MPKKGQLCRLKYKSGKKKNRCKKYYKLKKGKRYGSSRYVDSKAASAAMAKMKRWAGRILACETELAYSRERAEKRRASNPNTQRVRQRVRTLSKMWKVLKNKGQKPAADFAAYMKQMKGQAV